MSRPGINKYQKGKVYKLLNSVNDEVYVGSTCQKLLSKRMGKHREDALLHNSPVYKLMKEIGIDKFYIELIENYPCNSKDELTAKENYWIRQISTLNTRIEGRTQKEYYEENKQHILENQKKYRELHRDTLAEYHQDYYEQNKEILLKQKKEHYDNNKESIRPQHKEYRDKNKDVLAEKSKEYYEENKEAINTYKKEWYDKHKEQVLERVKKHNEEHREEKNEYYKERYQKKKAELSVKTECVCGGCYTVMSKSKHLKTKLHQEYEESIKLAI